MKREVVLKTGSQSPAGFRKGKVQLVSLLRRATADRPPDVHSRRRSLGFGRSVRHCLSPKERVDRAPSDDGRLSDGSGRRGETAPSGVSAEPATDQIRRKKEDTSSAQDGLGREQNPQAASNPKNRKLGRQKTSRKKPEVSGSPDGTRTRDLRRERAMS